MKPSERRSPRTRRVVVPAALASAALVSLVGAVLYLAPSSVSADSVRAGGAGTGGAETGGPGAPGASANETTAPADAHDCLVEPYVSAEVGSAVQGIVAGLLVDRGESVARGQPLAELESGLERATLAQAEARAEMDSEIASREADLALARLDKTRFADLHARRLAPEQQRDEASARYRVAGAALVQALENRKLAYLELERARRLLEQRTIRSPVDGVVVRRLLFPGELVHDEPVMRIAALDPLRVEVVLPGRLFGTVRAGERAKLFLELGEEEAVSARVEVVDRLLDTRSGTFGVRLTLPNPDHAIAAGQKCRVAFDEREGERSEAAEVPIAAARPVSGESPPVTSDAVRDALRVDVK